MQLAFDAAEEIDVNGKKIKTVKEWMPYNPTPVARETRTVSVYFPGKANALDWYRNTVMGYSGLTVEQYLKRDVDLLFDDLKNLLYDQDALLFLNWVYQIVRHKGDVRTQQVWQMPEDFYKSFSQNTAESIQPYPDKILVSAKLQTRPVQRPTHNDLEEHPELGDREWAEQYPVYFLKPLVYWLMKVIAHKRGLDLEQPCVLEDLTMNEVYEAYDVCQLEYWGYLEDEQYALSRIIEQIEGFMPDGRKYAVELTMLDVRHLL